MRLCHVLAIGEREWRAALVVSMGDVVGQGFLVGSTERAAPSGWAAYDVLRGNTGG